jgi:hypothetical protein
MTPSEILREAQAKATNQPTAFGPIGKNADRIFGAVGQGVKALEIGFYVRDKNDHANRSKVYSYRELGIDTNEIEDVKEYEIENFSREKQVQTKQVEVVPVYSDDVNPELDDRGRLAATRNPTYSDQVKQAVDYRDRPEGDLIDVKKLASRGVLTVANAQEVIAGHRDSELHKSALAPILDKSRIDKGWEPTVLVDDVNKVPKGFLSEFGEISGPLGLLMGTINGNGTRVLPKFFDAQRSDIIKQATIHFHPSTSHKLVDSYIEYRGQIVRVSSKYAGGAISGGNGASFKGIYQSLAEIGNNPQAKDMFNSLLRSKPELRDKFQILQKIVGTFESDEEDSDLSDEELDEARGAKAAKPQQSNDNAVYLGIKTRLDLLKQLSGGRLVTDSDIAIIDSLWSATNSDTGTAKLDILFGRALGVEADRWASQRADATNTDRAYINATNKLGSQKFSQNFKSLLVKFDINKYGEASIGGSQDVKKTDESNQKRGWWLRLKKAIVYEIAISLNSTSWFSFLCTWILNHGNFIQIDMRSSEGTNRSGGKSLIVSNISATWPSTAVDRVVMLPSPTGAGMQYKLLINGNVDWQKLSAAEQKKILSNMAKDDHDFGFTDRERETMLHTQRDLARFNKQWSDELGSRDTATTWRDPSQTNRKTATNASKILTRYFAYLSNAGIVPDGSYEREEDKLSAATYLITRIIKDGYVPPVLLRATQIQLKQLEFSHGQINEAEDDYSDPIEPTQQDLVIGQQDTQLAKAVLNAIYWAIYMDYSLRDGENDTAQQAATKLITYIEQFEPGEVSRVAAAVKTRLAQPTQPNVEYTDSETTHTATKKQKSDAIVDSNSVKLVKELIHRYNLIDAGTTATPQIHGVCRRLMFQPWSLPETFKQDLYQVLNDDEVKQSIKQLMASLNDPSDIQSLSEAYGVVNDTTVIAIAAMFYYSALTGKYLKTNKQQAERYFNLYYEATTPTITSEDNKKHRNNMRTMFNDIIGHGDKIDTALQSKFYLNVGTDEQRWAPVARIPNVSYDYHIDIIHYIDYAIYSPGHILNRIFTAIPQQRREFYKRQLSTYLASSTSKHVKGGGGMTWSDAIRRFSTELMNTGVIPEGTVTREDFVSQGPASAAKTTRPTASTKAKIDSAKKQVAKKQVAEPSTQQPTQPSAQRFDGEERYRVAMTHARNDQQFVTKLSGLKYKSDFAEQVIDYFNTHPGNDKTDLVFLYRELDDFLTMKESSRILKGILG